MFNGLMQRLVKSDVLQEKSTATELMKIDLQKEANLIPCASINLGHSAEAILRKSKTVDAPD